MQLSVLCAVTPRALDISSSPMAQPQMCTLIINNPLDMPAHVWPHDHMLQQAPLMASLRLKTQQCQIFIPVLHVIAN